MSSSTQVAAAPQESDASTRHELLEPSSAKFHVIYDLSVIRPRAEYYFNPVRKGTVISAEKVTDLATGAPLEFQMVDNVEAHSDGFDEADLSMNYLRVKLARPVPEDGGQVRIRIDKTYEDHKSYHAEGDGLIFDRSIGVKRNDIVLPPGYALVACNYPSEIAQESDGRIRISFFNPTPADAPIKLEARKAPELDLGPKSGPVVEPASQTRNVVYVLSTPESHRFDVQQDITEVSPGADHYDAVVQSGRLAAPPFARNLNTGETLQSVAVKGAEFNAASSGNPAPQTNRPNTDIALFKFAPIKSGTALNLRVFETYIDAGRYRLNGNDLLFEHRFSSPSNAVVLPPGWLLTGSSSPAAISQTEDNRTRLTYLNPRHDALTVSITARRAF